MKNKGLILVVSGPSGVGKDTVLERFFEKSHNTEKSVSATTRDMRDGEINGKDYYFISKDEFKKRIGENDFLEYAEYCGNFYGTPKKELFSRIDQGINVILKIEVQGGAQIREKCPDGVFVFIAPPSREELRRRLTERGTDTKEQIENRIQTAFLETKAMEHYDYVIVNDDLDKAVSDLECIIKSELLKVERNLNIKGELLK